MSGDDPLRFSTDRAPAALTVNAEPFAKLPALAARLKVEPVRAGHNGTVLLTMASGESYDLFDLINAVLDRLDAAAAAPDKEG